MCNSVHILKEDNFQSSLADKSVTSHFVGIPVHFIGLFERGQHQKTTSGINVTAKSEITIFAVSRMEKLSCNSSDADEYKSL